MWRNLPYCERYLSLKILIFKPKMVIFEVRKSS